MNCSQIIVTDFDPNGPFAGLILPERFRKRQAETRFKQEWKLTPQQYWQMMLEPFRGPKRQRGSIIMSLIGANAEVGGVVLTAHSATATDATLAQCEINFRNDGRLQHVRSPGANINHTGEWWSAGQTTDIGSLYEVRALSTGKSGTWDISAAADDVWITISSDRSWGVTRSSTGTDTTSATFEVGPDGVESAEDSATMTCEATVT